MTLEAGTGEEAQAAESIEATIDGDDMTIGFNPTYLLDGLSAIDGRSSSWRSPQPTKPGRLSGAMGAAGDRRRRHRTSATC